MAIRPIRLYPDEVLRVKCKLVEHFDADLRRLVRDLKETMYSAPGVGLAAPQVGIELRLALVDVTVGEESGTLRVLVNPRILESEGSQIDDEGCLSIPGLTAKVKRPERVRLAAQDLAGKAVELVSEGFEARAVCHELDHLNGVLFPDRLTGLRKDRARRFLRRLGEGTRGSLVRSASG